MPDALSSQANYADFVIDGGAKHQSPARR